MTSPRLLIISPQVHPQPYSGTGMRAHFQAVHLSEDAVVTVASDSGVFDVSRGEFTRRPGNSVAEASPLGAYLKSETTRRHYAFEKFRCARWEIPSFRDYDLVILHYPALLELLSFSDAGETRVVLDTHNNEREYFETVLAQTANPVKRRAMRRQADTAERLIRSNADRIAATISVSESDRRWVEQFCHDGTSHLVVPNNLFRFEPTTWTGESVLLYIGTLNVTMNLQALDWFLEHVWPAVKAEMPTLKMVVAGRNPSDELTGRLRAEGIDIIANPPTLQALYSRAKMSIVPALSGSGGKIKVCESLANGVPVLTTPHGVVGQPDSIMDCCTIREDASDWVREISAGFQLDHRVSDAWTSSTAAALNDSYFGNSIRKVLTLLD